MPTATPKVENVVDGKIQRWSIEANDPELDEVFAVLRGGEIGLSGDVRPSPHFDGRDATPLRGTWTVQLSGGKAEGVDIGQTRITPKGRVFVIEANLHDELDEVISRFFSDDERERLAGDSSFDSDHANEVLGSEKIIFYREIEQPDPEPDPDPSIPEDEEPEEDQDDNSMIRNKNRKFLIAGAIIVTYVVISR
jgi:hypothetical protein